MIPSLLLSAALLIPAPASGGKTVAHVDLLDRETVLVVYSDCSAAVTPFSGVRVLPNGNVEFTQWVTFIEAPTSDELVTRWTDVRGLQREVRTNCATLKQIDCAIQHNKMVDIMLQTAPAQKVADK